MQTQQRFSKPEVKYSYGPYNKFNDDEQWIRITEGCPHNCPYCYEPQEIKIFEIPEIVRNDVKIMDMNLLCKPEALDIIKELGEKRPNGKVVYYDMICGIDHRFLTQEIAGSLKKSRFRKIRIAWDWYYRDQFKIKDAIEMLDKAGYKRNNIMIFMICNWKISYRENLQKLDLCKVWNVQVADCYYDNQVGPDFIPLFWRLVDIKDFRHRCRKHNQLVNFKIDPEVRSSP
jgi:hypothetical protein